MSLVVVGSIALDSVETPHGKVKEALGGSAVYFSYAASFFTPVRLVGVVGRDFPRKFIRLLQKRPIDMAGLHVADGKTFRWSGAYKGDMNQAETRWTKLNVFGTFEPRIPDQFRDSRFVFLANGSPVLQRRVLEQMKRPRFSVADTMNLWIETERRALLKLLSMVDAVVLNDAEARMLTGEANLVAAGRKIQKLGPRCAVIKKGEHGSMLVWDGTVFVMPAYPLERVNDPTGAGDSFAGGMMGYLAGTGRVSRSTLKKAILHGTICASFNVEDFSLNRFRRLSRAEISRRCREFVSAMKIT